MNHSYVIEHLPLASQLARFVDWALILHVLFAGAALYFAWRAMALHARVRELEGILQLLRQAEQPSARSDQASTVTAAEKNDTRLPR